MSVLCVASTAINVVLFGLDASHSTKAKAPLRRPSQYRNLKSVTATPKAKYTTNYPIVLQQVSSAEPDKAFPDDAHRYNSFRGYISPEERPFEISSEVSSILV